MNNTLKIKKHQNFLVEIKNKYQFDVVKSFLEKLYNYKLANNDNNSISPIVIGYLDKPTYDFKMSQSHNSDIIITFREFLECNIDIKDWF